MTATADPPPPNSKAYRKKRLLGPGFWLMIIFSLVCVTAGAVVAVYGPRLFADLRSRTPAAKGVGLFNPPAVPFAQQPSIPPAPSTQTANTAGGVILDASSDLAQRLVRLEATEARLADTASALQAVAALSDAARGSQPFAQALKPLAGRPALAADIAALRPLAATGAPSRAALATGFAKYAALAAGAGRLPADNAGLLGQARYAIGRIISVRQVGPAPGGGLDAVLGRAEALAADGDVEAALASLQALPPAARDAMAPWRDKAARRVEADRRIGELRNRVLADLPATAGAPR